MAGYYSYQDVLNAFAKLGIEQRIPIIADDSVEQAAKYLGEYVKALHIGEDYVFTVDPELFLKNAYETLDKDDFPWVRKVTEPRKKQLETVTGTMTAMFLNAMNIYMMRCQIHPSLLEMSFDEPVNYFVKSKEEGASPLQGPFIKVPSTFFGGKQLSFWEMDFPADKDLIVAYTNEGFLRMIMTYKGKSTAHF